MWEAIDGHTYPLENIDGGRMIRPFATLHGTVIPEVLLETTKSALLPLEVKALRILRTEIQNLESDARPLLVALARLWTTDVPDVSLDFSLMWASIHIEHDTIQRIELHFNLEVENHPYLDVYGDWIAGFQGNRLQRVERTNRKKARAALRPPARATVTGCVRWSRPFPDRYVRHLRSRQRT